MLAYIVEMTARLVELHRVLKPTGSLYLHCDPTASHYLKVVLDAIFEPQRFFSEIVWKRWSAHGDAKRYGAVHDAILFYGKTGAATFNKQFIPYDDEYVRTRFKFVDADGRRYAEQNLSSPNPRPNLTYPYTASNGVTYAPHRNGWKVTPERMRQLDQEGRLHFPQRGERLRLKMYLDEQEGAAVQDLWTDIYGVGGSAGERLGYPTQKPRALLERIIASSSNPGDVILDPFCGCGTAIVAAEHMGRRWIGIDITYLAIAVMRARLKDSFGIETVDVIGQPTEVEGARQLAQATDGRYQFQWWALSLVDAKPLAGVKKKGADRGVDGVITFTGQHGQLESVIVSVKSGHVTSGMVRDLKGTVDRERASIGLFVTLEESTREMHREADTAGYYHSMLWNRDYPKIQILTIRQLLNEGRRPELPPFAMPTYPPSSRIPVAVNVEQETFLDDDGRPIERRPEDMPAASTAKSRRTRQPRQSAGSG